MSQRLDYPPQWLFIDDPFNPYIRLHLTDFTCGLEFITTFKVYRSDDGADSHIVFAGDGDILQVK